MTGRLNQVDLDTDLLLIVLARADDPLEAEHLLERVDAVDADPFTFDEAFPAGPEEFFRGVRMLYTVGQLSLTTSDGKHVDVTLTHAGELMADHLEAALDPAEEESLQDAGLVGSE